MIRIDRVVTRGGDGGETSLADGTRLRKDAPRIDTIGALDETNAALGLLHVACAPPHQALLARLQNELFDLGADIARPGAEGTRFPVSAVAAIEGDIAALNAALPPLRSFVLPGGTEAAARAHLARTTARRAERALVQLSAAAPITPAALQYMNRLSDLLFVLGRVLNQGSAEPVWVAAEKR